MAEKLQIDVNAIFFRAAFECVSKDETRYYLGGVYIAPHPKEGVLLTATDGHRLICIHDVTGKCEKAAIVRGDRRALAGVKLDKRTSATPRFTVDSDGHAYCGEFRSSASAIIDGTYPDYPRILTPLVHGAIKKSYAPGSFNPEYLAAFAKISGMLGSSSAAMRVVIFSATDPALILFSSCPQAFGVLMPMRSTTESALPAFMRPVVEPLMPKTESVAKPSKVRKAA